MGRDSGAPSPDNAPFFQPANVRLAQNQQRKSIQFLTELILMNELSLFLTMA